MKVMTTPQGERREWIELQVLLDRTGMTQTELSQATGISAPYINDMLRGRRNPGTRSRKRIAEALKVPVTMLMIPGVDY